MQCFFPLVVNYIIYNKFRKKIISIPEYSENASWMTFIWALYQLISFSRDIWNPKEYQSRVKSFRFNQSHAMSPVDLMNFRFTLWTLGAGFTEVSLTKVQNTALQAVTTLHSWLKNYFILLEMQTYSERRDIEKDLPSAVSRPKWPQWPELS